MSPNPSPRRVIGLTLSAGFLLGTAGCQHEPSPAEMAAQPAEVESRPDREVVPPPALTDSDPAAIQPLDSLSHAAWRTGHGLDVGVKQTAAEFENTLPPPGAPAPTVGEGLDSAVTEINQGVKQVSGEFSGAVRETTDEVRQSVRQKVDSVNQQIQQSADQLARKARAQARQKTDQFLDQVEQDGKPTLQQGLDRARQPIQSDVAPKD
jgi:ElaB/YqjD/DUF883 family membrane-anchored ribosome-binding protein